MKVIEGCSKLFLRKVWFILNLHSLNEYDLSPILQKWINAGNIYMKYLYFTLFPRRYTIILSSNFEDSTCEAYFFPCRSLMPSLVYI